MTSGTLTGAMGTDRHGRIIVQSKGTNPKDIVGATKIPLDLVPPVIMTEVAMGFLEGALKYGRFNWRILGVRASIYYGAILRHLFKWWNGQNADPLTRVKDLSSAMAGIGILLDAELQGCLTDDRPPRQLKFAERLDELQETMKHLQEIFQKYTPYQYTIADGPADPSIQVESGRVEAEAARSV